MAYESFVPPRPKPPIGASRGTSFAEGAGEFFFGTTSFKNAAKDAAQGDWAGAAANAGWGALALGSTAISVVPGVGTAAGLGIKGAATAAKAGKAVKTLEAGKTTATGVRGGQVLEKAVAGGKPLTKEIAFSPGQPFKPPVKPLAPTAPNRTSTVSPKYFPDAAPTRFTTPKVLTRLGLDLVEDNRLSNILPTDPKTQTDPETQTKPEVKKDPTNKTKIDTKIKDRKDDGDLDFDLGKQDVRLQRTA
jgi:hypothetical protein